MHDSDDFEQTLKQLDERSGHHAKKVNQSLHKNVDFLGITHDVSDLVSFD